MRKPYLAQECDAFARQVKVWRTKPHDRCYCITRYTFTLSLIHFYFFIIDRVSYFACPFIKCWHCKGFHNYYKECYLYNTSITIAKLFHTYCILLLAQYSAVLVPLECHVQQWHISCTIGPTGLWALHPCTLSTHNTPPPPYISHPALSPGITLHPGSSKLTLMSSENAHPLAYIKHFMSGGVGGVCLTLAGQPLDTIKVSRLFTTVKRVQGMT